MKIDIPSYFERLGSVNIHSLQRVYELDSGKANDFHIHHKAVREFNYGEISNILNDLAIVIPIKNGNLKILEGVLSGIPNECLIVIVSNSSRIPADKYQVEISAIRQLVRFTDKRMVVIHQSDQGLKQAFKKVGYRSILDSRGNIIDGRTGALIIGMLIAKMFHREYVGFIDGSNYLPGAANEYVKIFAAGFGMSNAPYTNVRVSWSHRPMIKDNSLHFAKLERVSKEENRYLNTVLSSITGFETDIIVTASSNDHALSIPLAECLHFSAGLPIEQYELIDMFEKFGGLLADYPQTTREVEVFQIESRNPHFKDVDKDNDKNSTRMLETFLLNLYRSKICSYSLKKILDQMRKGTSVEKNLSTSRKSMKCRLLEPIKSVQISEFKKELLNESKTFTRFGSL
jgi:mannosyl-3-phosphoglycerate synthase